MSTCLVSSPSLVVQVPRLLTNLDVIGRWLPTSCFLQYGLRLPPEYLLPLLSLDAFPTKKPNHFSPFPASFLLICFLGRYQSSISVSPISCLFGGGNPGSFESGRQNADSWSPFHYSLIGFVSSLFPLSLFPGAENRHAYRI